MPMQTLLLISVALFSGLLMTRLFDKFHMPDVTACLVTGVLIGPCVLGRLGIPCLGFNTFEQVDSLSMIPDVALGFIPFCSLSQKEDLNEAEKWMISSVTSMTYGFAFRIAISSGVNFLLAMILPPIHCIDCNTQLNWRQTLCPKIGVSDDNTCPKIRDPLISLKTRFLR